jgi:hypothetical protein
VRAALFAAVGLVACDAKPEWVRFNAEAETVELKVTAEDALGAAVSRDLNSTTGAVAVGSIAVDPSSGPVGTDHRITVRVLDPWDLAVQRVTVDIDSGARGVETFELVQDSADLGGWVVSVTSLGEPAEVRTDTITPSLFTLEGDDAVDGDTDTTDVATDEGAP